MSSVFFYYDSNIILHLHYAYSMMHFLLFCSVSSSLLPSSLTHPTALSICWPGNFPLSFPSYINLSSSISTISCFSNVASILPLLHTSGSLLCWWGPSPIQDVWACSFPPHHLLRCSLAPSLNGEPSPRRRGHAMHDPRSPFSQNHETISSTAFLNTIKYKTEIYNTTCRLEHLYLSHPWTVYVVKSCVKSKRQPMYYTRAESHHNTTTILLSVPQKELSTLKSSIL